MASRTKQLNEGGVYLSFGSGVKFASEEYYLKIMGPLGLSKKGFRSLCRALGVPMLHIGKVRLVELTTWRIALRAVSRAGRPDFIVLGSEASGRGEPISTLDAEDLQKNWEWVLSELLAARHLNNLPPDVQKVSKLAKKAAERIVQFSMQTRVVGAQEEYDRRNLNHARIKGIIHAVQVRETEALHVREPSGHRQAVDGGVREQAPARQEEVQGATQVQEEEVDAAPDATTRT